MNRPYIFLGYKLFVLKSPLGDLWVDMITPFHQKPLLLHPIYHAKYRKT